MDFQRYYNKYISSVYIKLAMWYTSRLKHASHLLYLRSQTTIHCTALTQAYIACINSFNCWLEDIIPECLQSNRCEFYEMKVVYCCTTSIDRVILGKPVCVVWSQTGLLLWCDTHAVNMYKPIQYIAAYLTVPPDLVLSTQSYNIIKSLNTYIYLTDGLCYSRQATSCNIIYTF